MSLFNYYISEVVVFPIEHYKQPEVIISTAHPAKALLIGPAALTPTVEDFRLTYCIAMLMPPSKQLMESAARAVADMNTFISMRGQ